MSVSTLKPLPCWISPSTGANEVRSRPSRISMMQRQALPPLQVKEKEKPLSLQGSFNTGASRRELFHLTAASLGFLSLLSPAHAAEVQTKNATIIEKILEKFQELTGLSKPKDEGKDKKPGDKPEDTKSKLKDEAGKKSNNGGGEKKPPTPTPAPAPAPAQPSSPGAPPSIINGKTVETTALP